MATAVGMRLANLGQKVIPGINRGREETKSYMNPGEYRDTCDESSCQPISREYTGVLVVAQDVPRRFGSVVSIVKLP